MDVCQRAQLVRSSVARPKRKVHTPTVNVPSDVGDDEIEILSDAKA
jgi:hypothetical protein